MKDAYVNEQNKNVALFEAATRESPSSISLVAGASKCGSVTHAWTTPYVYLERW